MLIFSSAVNLSTVFKQVQYTLVEQVPSVVFKHMHEHSFKTLADRFKRLVAQRMEAMKRKRKTFGIVENYRERLIINDILTR